MQSTLRLLALSLVISATSAKSEELQLLLDWFVNPDHAALVIAQERGYFDDAGLEVELIAPADPSQPPRLLAAGQGDFAVSYQPQLHLFADKGLPLMRIATLVATPLNSLVVLRDSDIKSIADLRSKKVGYSVGGFETIFLGSMLGTAGLSMDDIELVNVNFSLSPSLYAGNVDAVIGAFRNFELNQMDIEGKPGQAWYPEENGIPAYDELILLAHRDQDSGLSLKVLQALEQATTWLINHPQAAWELFIGAYPELDDELNRRAWRDTLPRLALRPAALDTRRYQDFADYLHAQGIIDNNPEVSTYAREL